MKPELPTKNTKTKKAAQYWLFLRRSMIVKKILILAALLLGISFFVQCKKDKNVLGTDVQPGGDELNASMETFSVFAHSTRYDSIVSLNVDEKFIGSNRDPNFGLMDVGLYVNANMNVGSVSFSDTTELLSAEIILEVNNEKFIGKRDAVITFSVFPLDSTLNGNRAYYSTNNRLHRKTQVLATYSTSFVTYNQRPAIRIPIDLNYAQEIFDNTTALSSNASFQSIYKGFYIQASCGSDEGVIYTCNLAGDNSGFYLRYKKGASAADTAFRFRFFGTDAARYNTVSFDPLPVIASQFNGDTAQGANKLYLKGLGASRIRVHIPELTKQPDSLKWAVNRAEVIFYVDADFSASIQDITSSYYRVPPMLSLMPIDSIGREILSFDQRSSTYISRYNGIYDSDNKRYVFNIPLHAQAILRGEQKNYGFYIVVADPTPPFTIRRDNFMEAVIFSGSNTTLKPEFNISYVGL